MIENIDLDLENFVEKEISLPPVVKTALWDLVSRIKENADDPDLIGVEKEGFRTTQFTTGWVLDWEITKRTRVGIIDLSYGKPREVKLWDIRELLGARHLNR